MRLRLKSLDYGYYTPKRCEMRPPGLEVILFQKVDQSVERSKRGGTSRKASVSEKFVASPLKAEREPSAGQIGELQAEGLPLVINANLASASLPEADPGRSWERTKWERLHTARELLRGSAVEKLREGRTQKCIWVPIAFVVELRKIQESRAFFTGVYTCGNRAVCPMCNSKISAWDREELQDGMARVASKGWFKVMITYNLRHNKYMLCADSLRSLNQAMSRTKSGRKWQKIKKKYGIEGSITALEVTWSRENGFHWHKHVLEILNRSLTDDEIRDMRDEIAELYLQELSKVGASADFEIAVDIKRGDNYVAEYISKFGHEPKVTRSGVAYEMANYSGKTKGAEYGHYTMFQLLDLAAQGDAEAGRAFLEYAEAVRGRALLSWSVDLRAKLGMGDEVTDDVKVESGNDDDDDESRSFALFHNKRDWPKVRIRSFDILDASKGISFDAFQEYCKAKGIYAEYPLPESVLWNEDGKL